MIQEVILVDDNDIQTGTAEKIEAHKKGLLHRAFSVFLLDKNKDGEAITLLQQRSMNKYHCAGLWTNSCCSHPIPGEQILQAGKRRCQEELGVNIGELTEIGSFTYKAKFANGLTEHEFDHVLISNFPQENLIPVNNKEVMATKWITFKELFTNIENEQKEYTPWLKMAAKLVFDHLNGTT